MNLEFLLPGVAVLAMAAVLGRGRWPAIPRTSVWALTTVAAVAAATVISVIVATTAGFLLGPAQRTEIIRWCRIIPFHHEVTTIEGVLTTVALVVIGVRVNLVFRRRRAAIANTAGKRVAVLDTHEPFAYAAPGKPGCVVVSTGLLSALEPRERQVVFAHERAHLRQAHHRFLLVGALATASPLPPPCPLMARPTAPGVMAHRVSPPPHRV